MHASERAARRAALEAWLTGQLRSALDRGHVEEAYDQLKQAATLWDAEHKGIVRGASGRRRCHKFAKGGVRKRDARLIINIVVRQVDRSGLSKRKIELELPEANVESILRKVQPVTDIIGFDIAVTQPAGRSRAAGRDVIINPE